MSGSRTSLTILASGQHLIVDSVVVAGRAWPAYTDAAMLTPVTFPATVTDDTTWWGDDETGWLVLTVTQADGTDVSRGGFIAPGSPLTLAPLPSTGEVAADVGHLNWQDLRVSLARANTGAGNPSITTFRDGLRAYAMDKTTTMSLTFDMQLPHGLVGNATHPGGEGEIRPHIHWSPGNSAHTGTVVWGLEWTWASAVNPPNNTFETSTTLYTTQSALGTAYAHQIAAFDAIDVTEMRDSAILMCRLFRAAALDTFDADAFALSFDAHYQTHDDGTVEEYPSS